MKEGIVFHEDGRYEMPLPFKEPAPNLPNNRCVAVRRLSQLKIRFERNKGYRDHYVAFMDALIKNGYVENIVAKKCDADQAGEKVWYIPHNMGCITPRSQRRSEWFFIAPQNSKESA